MKDIEYPGEPMTFRTRTPEVLLTLHGANAEPVVVIKTDGTLLWKNREVATDAEFVEAVKVIVQRLWPTRPEGDIDGRC